MKLRERNTECSLKDTFLCRLLLLLPCIFQCRSDSLCPRVVEARTPKKNYFERIFCPKKRTDYRVDFLYSGNAYQSQTDHHHSLSWLLPTPLFYIHLKWLFHGFISVLIFLIPPLSGFAPLMKWMNLTQMTIISTTVGRNTLEQMGVAIMVNKRVQNAVPGCNLKNDRMISVPFQGKPFNITVIKSTYGWISSTINP